MAVGTRTEPEAGRAVTLRRLPAFLHDTFYTSNNTYEVQVNGAAIGTVGSWHQSSYRSENTGSCYRWGFRGYRRYWEAYLAGNPVAIGRKYGTRKAAVEALLAAGAGAAQGQEKTP